MPDVKYVDEDGYTWLKRVTERAKPEHYNRGITIGPPDLSELDLTQDERKVLQEGLVNSRLVNAELVHGSRNHLFNVVKAALPKRNTKAVIRHILSIMKRDI